MGLAKNVTGGPDRRIRGPLLSVNLFYLERDCFCAVFGFLGSNFYETVSLVKLLGDFIQRPQVIFTCHQWDVPFCREIFKVAV